MGLKEPARDGADARSARVAALECVRRPWPRVRGLSVEPGAPRSATAAVVGVATAFARASPVALAARRGRIGHPSIKAGPVLPF